MQCHPTHMLSNPLFSSNPWHSWHSPCQVENIQTLSEDNLFDDDMTSISNSGDCIDGTAPAQSQLDTLPPIANASLDALTPVTCAQLDASDSVAHAQLDASASVTHVQPDASTSAPHVQLDASTSVTHVQLEAPTSVTPSDLMIDAAGQHKVLQLEHDNVWWTPEPEYIPNVDTNRPAEPETPMDLGEIAPSTSKRPMDLHLAPANKKPILAVASDKCHHDEVDYSLSLHKELYAKEGELSAKEDLIDQLRMELQKKNVQSQSQEHTKAQEAAAQRYTAQLDGFCHQLKLSMHTEVDRLQANWTAEMEGCIQEEITRLKELLQAEKEQELANIEQHHSCSQKLALPMSLEGDMDMELPELTARACKGQPKQTARSSTLCICNQTYQERSRDLQDDNDNGTGRPSGPELRPDNISVTEDDNDDTRNPIMSTSECMPHHKRKKDREVALEKATEPSHHHDFILVRLYITQDVDFITHKPASVHDVHAYKHEDGPTPNENTIAFDLSQNYSSPWNAFLLELLLQELQSHCREENWPIKKSDNYIREILRDHYKCLHTIWRNAQPKVAATGHLEMPGKVEAHLINEWTQASKESRQATHHHNLAMAWTPHQDLRIHATKKSTTKQDAVKGLPLALYDGAWIASLTECQKE
ncbi:hypothetical protein EDC04DRAFT_2613708 [Pisolithus marmoratus]|nr:hypothetical protein EDC04DRAFT_2613708 [Pisolithus marmoratus]